MSASVLLGFLRNRFSAPSLGELSKLPLSGKTVLVTGASSGLGLEAARHYVRLGASHVILGVRSQAKGETAKQSILSDIQNASTHTQDAVSHCSIDVWIIDLSSFTSVQTFANRARDELETLDIAVLNAAVSNNEFKLSQDGWEESLEVNMLSTTLLGLLLLPTLQRSTMHQPGSKRCLTIVASRAHQIVQDGAPWQAAPNVLNALNQPSSWGGFGERYGVSKLLLIYAVRELAKLATGPEGKCAVIVNYSCPGACKSGLARDWEGSWARRVLLFLIQTTICKTAEEGARTLILASGLGDESHGRWIHNDRLEE